MSNYKVELERTERQDLEIKKHISDVKDIVKNKVNKDVNGLNSIKELLENETLGGYIVGDKIKEENLEKVYHIEDNEYDKLWTLVNVSSFLNVIKVDSDNNSYIVSSPPGAAYSGALIKLSPQGDLLKRSTYPGYQFSDIDLDSKNNIGLCYSLSAKLISQETNTIWEINTGGRAKRILFNIDDSFYIRTSLFNYESEDRLMLYSDIGTRIWSVGTFKSGTKSYNIERYKDESVLVTIGNSIVNFSKNGDKIKEIIKLESTVNDLKCDSDYNIFVISDGKIMMISENDGVIWTLDSEYNIQSICIDEDGNLHTAGKNVVKISKDGVKLVTIYAGAKEYDVRAIGTNNNAIIIGKDNGDVLKFDKSRELIGYKVLKVERGL